MQLTAGPSPADPLLPPGRPPPGLILAGGRGLRLGGVDKALLPLGDGVVLDAVLDRLRPQVGAMALGANGDPQRFAGRDLPMLADADGGGVGPLAGVLAGLDWAAGQGAESLITVAVDTPFFPADLVARLSAGATPELPLVLAETPDGRLHPTFGLWPVARREALRGWLAQGGRRLGGWAAEQGAVPVRFPDAAAFFNINRPDDLSRAQTLMDGLRA
ncbi:molybdenum cofactor guanylyltransferase MobA [Pseudooceanicola aestuarii]|uniref:molybdenum cofactor guanylyltransferase MobA n=1 Tax=Pseudooceanicola aestuarii TaxID=2697319 RepID=UPI0013D7BB6E|nr:molybdenum cofactor guanylyltransferase MobA [Pseudooceanicola aestuarii]